LLRAERDEHLASEVKPQVSAKRACCANLITQIDAYLAEHPGVTNPLCERGNLRMQLDDYTGAIKDYTEAIRLDGPSNALCYFGRGWRGVSSLIWPERPTTCGRRWLWTRRSSESKPRAGPSWGDPPPLGRSGRRDHRV
jgi:hypothetical protein